MIDGRDEDDLSRCLARFVTGEDRLFSAICWERRLTGPRWFALWLIVDIHFWEARGERGHCRAAWARERAALADLPGRLRRAGM